MVFVNNMFVQSIYWIEMVWYFNVFLICTFMHFMFFIYFCHAVSVNWNALIGNNHNKRYFKRNKLYSKNTKMGVDKNVFIIKFSTNFITILFPIKMLLETHKNSGIWFNLMLKTFTRSNMQRVEKIRKSIWKFDNQFLVNWPLRHQAK